MNRRDFLKGAIVTSTIILLPIPVLARIKSSPYTRATWQVNRSNFNRHIDITLTVSCGEERVQNGIRFLSIAVRRGERKRLNNMLPLSKGCLIHWYENKRMQGRLPTEFGKISTEDIKRSLLFEGIYYN